MIINCIFNTQYPPICDFSISLFVKFKYVLLAQQYVLTHPHAGFRADPYIKFEETCWSHMTHVFILILLSDCVPTPCIFKDIGRWLHPQQHISAWSKAFACHPSPSSPSPVSSKVLSVSNAGTFLAPPRLKQRNTSRGFTVEPANTCKSRFLQRCWKRRNPFRGSWQVEFPAGLRWSWAGKQQINALTLESMSSWGAEQNNLSSCKDARILLSHNVGHWNGNVNGLEKAKKLNKCP